jgi:CRP-like cAMP-binding protein
MRMTGREGMTGLPYLLGAHSMREEIVVQVAGSALRMSAAQFKTAFDQSEALRRILLRFINAALSMAAQSAACSRRHSLEQRCARWLLNASDRIESDNADDARVPRVAARCPTVRSDRDGLKTPARSADPLRARPADDP